MKKFILAAVVLLLAVQVQAKLKIVSSSSDLASIAFEIGGDFVDITPIAKGSNNLHYVELLPSYMLKVARADIYLKVGLNLDYWADNIIDGSRNGDLTIIDCSQNITPLEVPTEKVDASMGDVHPDGNPHYWLDPNNGFIIAENIYNGLIVADPDHEDDYKYNLDLFNTKLRYKIEEWQKKTADWDRRSVIAYHKTWPYLSHAFNLHVKGFIEPKPGIEPTASHTVDIIELMKAQAISLIIVEPYFSKRTPESIAETVGATVVTIPSSVGGVKNADSYFDLFDRIIELINNPESTH